MQVILQQFNSDLQQKGLTDLTPQICDFSLLLQGRLAMDECQLIFVELIGLENNDCQIIEKFCNINPDVPVIAISDSPDDDLICLAIRSGAQYFLKATETSNGRLYRAYLMAMASRSQQEKRKRYEFIANNSKEFMTLINRDYVYEAVNDAYCLAHQKNRLQIVGFCVSSIWGHDRFQKYIKPVLDRCFSGEDVHFQTSFEFGDIGIRHLDVRYYPYYNAAKQISHAVVITRDISQLKNAEQKIIEQSIFLNNVINSLTYPFYVIDIKKNAVVHCNEKEKNNTGFSLAANLNHHPVIANFRQDIIDNSKSMVIEYKQTMDDHDYYYEIHGYPIFDQENQITHIIEYYLDISEKIRNHQQLVTAKEKAEIANIAKSEFLANMSHEIRTPMNGILGMTDLLLATNLSLEQQKYLEILKTSGDTLLNLLNDILDFSKIESGKVRLENIDFNLKESMDAVIEPIAMEAAKKGLVITLDIDADIPKYLQGDPYRLKQVIINLISNALKFTSDGGIVIIIRKISEEDYMGKEMVALRFTVIDSGIGIETEFQEYIFDSFTQADSSTTRKYGGTGLGLSICKKLVEIMGGEIGLISPAKSTPDLLLAKGGPGSEFWFNLRYAKVKQKKSKPIKKLYDFSDLQAIIIDDSRHEAAMVQQLLLQWGIKSFQTHSAAQGLDWIQTSIIEQTPLHLIFTDKKLPDMNGFEISARIHRMHPDISDIPIIMLTAYPENGDDFRCKTTKINGYLIKPVQSRELHSMINQVFTRMMQRKHRDENIFITRHVLEEVYGSNLTILVAEDNIVNQMLIKTIIEKIGHNVDIAIDGLQAIRMYREKNYDLIFMDVQMPNMNGLEATKQIRSIQSWPIPIVAITANAFKEDVDSCLNAGMDNYIAKPYNQHKIRQTLDHYAKFITSSKNK